jgi:hypothetical protein
MHGAAIHTTSACSSQWQKHWNDLFQHIGGILTPWSPKLLFVLFIGLLFCLTLFLFFIYYRTWLWYKPSATWQGSHTFRLNLCFCSCTVRPMRVTDIVQHSYLNSWCSFQTLTSHIRWQSRHHGPNFTACQFWSLAREGLFSLYVNAILSYRCHWNAKKI